LAALPWILCLAASPCVASSAPEEFHLNASVRSHLASLQQGWSEWLTAYELDDPDSESAALDRLASDAGAIGMSVMPDLSLGAAARAVESARVGDHTRAIRALAAAEQLDPGRPETSFARAAVHRVEGTWQAVLGHTALGYLRTLGAPAERWVWRHNLVLWLLATALLAGYAYVAILMIVRGPALFGSLLKELRKHMPVPLGLVLIFALLVWPLLLPAGLIGVALVWAVLLWAYCLRPERWVLGLLVLVFAVAPVVLDEQRRQITVELAPMARAAEHARHGRLDGTLFGDLQRLTLVLPESTAVSHLIADQHRRIGQCDQAKTLYGRVIEREPRNAAAWVDLGSCHFLQGEYDQAIEHYRRGISLDPDLAQAHFNLSLAFSELYRFAESDLALSRAQRLDSGRVAEWLRKTPSRGAAEVGAGLRRSEQIRAELKVSWVLEDESAAWSSPWRDYLSVPVALGAILLALLAGRFLPRGYLEEQAPPIFDGNHSLGPLYRIVVPGLPELEAGEPLRAAGSLIAFCGLVLLPWVAGYGYRQPWGFEPVLRLGWLVTLTGLALFLLARWRREVAF
jgi:tetratricopeptide (TPR) repeat protein